MIRHALLVIAMAGCWTASPAPQEPAPAGGTWQPEPGKPRPTATTAKCDEISCLLTPDDPCCARLQAKKPLQPPPPPPPVTPASLDRAAIASTMSSIRGAVLACGTRASAKGSLKVKVAVSPSGVAVASIQQSLDPAIDACVVTAIGRARFPRAQAPTTFVYPYLF